MAYSRTYTVDLDNPNTINLNGVITYNLVNPFIDQIHYRAAEGTKSMLMVINSPGGEVYSGQLLIQAMQMAQEQGVHFRCIVSTIAASMAFQILSYCDEKMALPGSLLLWHPVRINFGGFGGTTLTPNQAKELSVELSRLETVLVSELRRNFSGVPKNFFYHHYNAETLFFAREVSSMLGLKLYNNIKGIDTMHVRRDNSFSGRISYICPIEKCKK